jgi:hypothetical protein
LRGLHDGRHVGRGPVEWIDGGEPGEPGSRGKKGRKQGDGPIYLEFRYGSGGAPLGYFWVLTGKPAHFGITDRQTV